MKTLRLVAICALILALLFLGVGVMLPTTWEVQVATVIESPPAAIFSRLNTLSRWPEWAPWNADMDPSAKWTFSGPDSGVGCTMSWSGEKLGNGSLVIVASNPERGISYELRTAGLEPASGSVELRSDSAGTTVKWRSKGDFGERTAGGYLVLMLKPVMSSALTQGLANLKQLCEDRG